MKKLTIYLFLILLISSCCQNHSDIIPGQNFISDEILEMIIANGHEINEGFDPPELEGRYILSPMILVSSNFEDQAVPGQFFSDETVRFYNFNSSELKVDIEYEEGGNIGFGEGSFITGSGNDFTIYVKVEQKDLQGHILILTKIYSGTLDNSGIKDLTLSLFMIEDNGDPAGVYIENGQGRLFKDNDGFSPEL